MTTEDGKKLDGELCRRWKGKFTREDLDFWARELGGSTIQEIAAALTKFKNSSRFVPKPSEILKLLPRRIDRSGGPVDEGSFADVLRRLNRQYEGRTDAEVYLRYHRNLWFCYGSKRRDAETARRMITSECVMQLQCAVMSEPEAQRAAAFVFDSPEMFRILLNDLRNGAVPDPFQTTTEGNDLLGSSDEANRDG